MHPSSDVIADVTTGCAHAQPGALTPVEHETLQLEAQRWKYAGLKEQHIRESLGESPTRYYQRLNALLDTEAAEVAYPMLVRRLRRLRDQRREARVAIGGRGQASRS